jgi:uncharacterized protein DUF4235
MSGKKGGAGGRILSALVGAAAAFAARKLLFFGWKKVTGKEPPANPEDPQVALSEALIWGILVGAGVSTAKMLATRATAKRPGSGESPAGHPPV